MLRDSHGAVAQLNFTDMRNTYSKQLGDDLMAAYADVLRNYDCHTQAEAYERTVQHAAPRFYVSAEKARVYICALVRGDRSVVDALSPLRREMYLALFDVVLRLSQKRQYHRRSVYYITGFAVNEPAPRFYVGAETMRKVHRSRRRKKSLPLTPP